MTSGCAVFTSSDAITLVAPAFEVALETSSHIRATRWTNHLLGRSVGVLDGAEVRAVLDRSDSRIWITGWRGETSFVGPSDEDDDPGIARGYADSRFDDRGWQGMHSPSHRWYEQDQRLRWARTHVFLPSMARDRPLRLVLGGFGTFDFRRIRVWLNGEPLGTREASGRWREPGVFDLGPDSQIASALRFGGDNVIALQLSGYIAREPRLEEVDPGGGRLMPLRSQWPAQFEQHLVVGEPDRHVGFRAVDVEVKAEGPNGDVRVMLVSDLDELRGELGYTWDAGRPVLRRSVRLSATERPVRLLRLDLLSVALDGAALSDGEQGFPVYVDDGWFASVEHPAGWAIGQSQRLDLRMYPGVDLEPGSTFEGMGTVLGAAGRAGARAAFLEHLGARSRRVRRDHISPRTIATAFGSWDYDPATEPGAFGDVVSTSPTETIVLDHVANVAAGRSDGLEVDTYVVDFWTDAAGDVALADRERFPRGLGPVRRAVEGVGARLGLWLDSSMAEWTIGENPLVSRAFTHDPGYGTERASLCRAAEPFRTLFANGLLHLVQAEGAELLKLDNLQSICHAPDHGHLPGIWSTEAIMSAQLEALRAVDLVAPGTFLMLYWGHRSPWWLLDADTLFEPGFWIEASHPAASPTLYVRDSVTQGLDQAQRYCLDVPALGKDSLGVWLSEWKWNSSIGRERWAEAAVMDLCRGSLLLQVWSDRDWLDPPGRRLLGQLAALLRAAPRAFTDPLPIGGDPWRDEPYGYACADGEQAFVALFNVTWRDTSMALELGPGWGLPEDRDWRVVRHYPDRAHLTASGPVRAGTELALRPFQVVLLEARAARKGVDDMPGLPSAPWPGGFDEPSRALMPTLAPVAGVAPLPLALDGLPSRGAPMPPAPKTKLTFRLHATVPPTPSGGLAVPWVRIVRDGLPLPVEDAGAHFAVACEVDGETTMVEPVVRDRTYSVSWQAWRVPIAPGGAARAIDVRLTAALPEGAALEPGGAFIPHGG